MFTVRIADRLAFSDLHHLINTAAGRVHFDAQLPVCRAGVQTQAAVHTPVEIDLLRLIDPGVRDDRKGAHDLRGFPDQTCV